MANIKSTVPRRSHDRARRRSLSAAAQGVRTVPAPPRRVKATHGTFLRLYAPRLAFNPWKGERAWRASRPKVLAFFGALVIVVALYEMFSNPMFFVDRLSVGGNRIVGSAELNQAAGVQGWNIFFLDSEQVENALTRLPEIKRAQVDIELPNLARARVVERLPRFVWESRGTTYWVDDEGIAIRGRANIPGLLYMRDSGGAAVRIGERVNSDAFNAAVSLRNAWPDGPALFEWTKEHGLAIRDEHQWLIYLGSARQMSDKLAALRIVAQHVQTERKTIEFIDLGNGLPYYREAVAQKP